MTLLEKIIYLADLTSDDRDYPDVDKVRRLAFSSLDQALLYSFVYIIGELLKKGQPICKDTYEAYNFYVLRS